MYSSFLTDYFLWFLCIFFKMLNIFITIGLNSIWQLLTSISFISFYGHLSCSFIWGMLLLAASYVCLCVFDRSALTHILVWWPYVVGVMWSAVVESFWIPEVGALLSLDWYWPIHVWEWSLGWLIVRLNSDHTKWAAVQVLNILSRIHLRRVWCLQRSPFDYAEFEINWTFL